MPTRHATDSEVQGAERTRQFADYIRRAALDAGFDVDTPRGGGKKALAEATGMSQTSVGRMLAGQTMPDPKFLERLAEVLHMPLWDLLVESGVVSPRKATPMEAAPAPASRITPAEAARQWGIRSPARIAMLEGIVDHLVREEQNDSGIREAVG
ncbi:helix-turn-helix transcriptional regulator [Streptomyces flavidovirens]|uniref:helix-turn-helix domain-containing protein n=1 Tax=Streptomyces flavidovirens TaxID=67298 RepID=UPI0033AC3A52